MYGTVARIRVKPGMEERMKALREERTGETAPQIPGFVAQYVYQMDADPSEYYLVVMFESKEAYFANANSAEQNERYQQMSDLMAAPPEWHDGEIVAAWQRQ